MAEFRIKQGSIQSAVVCENEQPFAFVIQTSYRVDILGKTKAAEHFFVTILRGGELAEDCVRLIKGDVTVLFVRCKDDRPWSQAVVLLANGTASVR